VSFTAQDSGWLLGGRCHLRAHGTLKWLDVNQKYSAELPLEAVGFEDGEARFVYKIGKLRASEPSLLILLREECAYRLDINGTHKEGVKLFRNTTHIQRRRASGERESFEPNPLGVPAVEIDHRVTSQEYRAILQAFAAPIGMDILDVDWNDPPEGREP